MIESQENTAQIAVVFDRIRDVLLPTFLNLSTSSIKK